MSPDSHIKKAHVLEKAQGFRQQNIALVLYPNLFLERERGISSSMYFSHPYVYVMVGLASCVRKPVWVQLL